MALSIHIFLFGMVCMFFIFMLSRAALSYNRNYSNYALYLFWMVIYLAVGFSIYFHSHGFLYSEWDKKWLKILRLCTQFFAYVAYFDFVSEFLQLKKYLPVVYKVFRIARKGLLLYTLLIIILILTSYYLDFVKISYNIIRILLCLVSIYSIYSASKIKEGIYKFFIIGNSLYLLLAITSWIIASVNDSNSLIMYGKLFFADLPLAIIVESICFSMGMSYKENLVFQEKNELQNNLIYQLELSHRRQLDYTSKLELEVKQRTATIVELERKQFEFEKLQILDVERNRIAKDMHDDLGTGLSTIHLLSTYLNTKMRNEHPELQEQIDKILKTSVHLNRNIREIIWTINSKEDTIQSLISFVNRFTQDFSLTTIQIIVQNYIPENSLEIKLTGTEKKNILLCIKESINNALKHSQGNQINIVFSMDDAQNLSIEIKDNGVGFDLSYHKPSGNGLTNIKNRMETCGGKAMVHSYKRGTSIILSMPIQNIVV